MVSIKEYKIAESLEEAYALNQKRANAVIGGMGWIKMQKKNIHTAIDLSGLGLDKIEEDNACFKIGAIVSLRDLETHQGLKDQFGAGIADSLKHIVGVQFRNCATVGGSIRMRFGFSDLLTVLLTLDSHVVCFKKGEIPLETYAEMPYDRDILTHIILKKRDIKTVYRSVRNSYSDLPLLNVAVSKCKLGYMAAVGAKPKRGEAVRDDEGILTGGVTEQTAQAFAQYVADNLTFNSNTRASGPYRKHLCQVLVRRCVLTLEGASEHVD